MQQTCKHKCKKSWKKMQLLAVPFFAFFLGASGLQKLKKLQKLEEHAKHNAEKKKKNEKHAKKHAKKSAEKMQLLELCIFAFLVGPPVRTAKSHKNCKNSRNMQKQCKKHAKKMPKKSDKHANSGTVHVLQKKQISRSCMFFACICCRGFWGCTFWVHCFCICFAFLSSFRPRISCFLLHNCNKSAAKCCDNVFFLVEFTSGTHTIICANYQSYPKRACFTRTSSWKTLGGSAAWHYTSSNDTGNFSQECQE